MSLEFKLGLNATDSVVVTISSVPEVKALGGIFKKKQFGPEWKKIKLKHFITASKRIMESTTSSQVIRDNHLGVFLCTTGCTLTLI